MLFVPENCEQNVTHTQHTAHRVELSLHVYWSIEILDGNASLKKHTDLSSTTTATATAAVATATDRRRTATK